MRNDTKYDPIVTDSIKEVTKLKRLKYIAAMSLPRDVIKDKMSARRNKITEHLAKCVMYSDSLGHSKYNHWIEHELANWISEINELISKPENKKLKTKFYRDILFGGLGTSYPEAKSNLTDLQLYNGTKSSPYPFREIDDDMIDRMIKVSEVMLGKVAPILATKNTFTKKDFESLLHTMLDPICLR